MPLKGAFQRPKAANVDDAPQAPDAPHFCVVARVRPFLPREIRELRKPLAPGQAPRAVVDVRDGNTIALLDPKTLGVKERFSFDQCFAAPTPAAVGRNSDFAVANPGSDANPIAQEEVYHSLGPRLLDCVLSGCNACLLAYGQTASGKTYTMMGDLDGWSERGVIPRLCEDLFARVRQLPRSEGAYRIEISFFEIYKERVKDLLQSSTAHDLRVRQHPVNGPFIEGLSSHSVWDLDGFLRLLHRGHTGRATGATAHNDKSSRSHAICTLLISQTRIGGSDMNVRVTKLHLVDLAGSERSWQGVASRETAFINQSLSTLGRVIRALADNSAATGRPSGGIVPPYRESLLTWLLSDSLGGNSQSFMIATLSPAPGNYDETLGTLRYACRARAIAVRVQPNKWCDLADATAVREEIRALRDELTRTKTLAQKLPPPAGELPPPNKATQELMECISASTVIKSKEDFQLAEAALRVHDRLQGEIDRLRETLQQLRAEQARKPVVSVNERAAQTDVEAPVYSTTAADSDSDSLVLDDSDDEVVHLPRQLGHGPPHGEEIAPAVTEDLQSRDAPSPAATLSSRSSGSSSSSSSRGSSRKSNRSDDSPVDAEIQALSLPTVPIIPAPAETPVELAPTDHSSPESSPRSSPDSEPEEAPRPYFGISFEDGGPAGLPVVGVEGPAAAGGMRVGDLLLAVDSQPISGAETLRTVLCAHKPGDQVRFRLRRDRHIIETIVVVGDASQLGEEPAEEEQYEEEEAAEEEQVVIAPAVQTASVRALGPFSGAGVARLPEPAPIVVRTAAAPVVVYPPAGTQSIPVVRTAPTAVLVQDDPPLTVRRYAYSGNAEAPPAVRVIPSQHTVIPAAAASVTRVALGPRVEPVVIRHGLDGSVRRVPLQTR
eukprot:TRINITY_DN97136_c0_g1_i1.p1 TRINITY_DN97136_c0_g1~~TRINITY_DN97136_c0_g1_i1.p1  ORF type:complete len:891 (-),score=128.06 TRINITY_DN97136_c0_g1_i1:24-2696(-)